MTLKFANLVCCYEWCWVQPVSHRIDRHLSIALLVIASLCGACSIVSAPREPSVPLTDADQIVLLQKAQAAHEQAQALYEQGHYRQAVAPARESLTLREGALGSKDERVAEALTTLGLVHSALVKLNEARPLLERALAIRRSAFGGDDPRVGESLTHLAAMLYAGGKFGHSMQLLEQSVRTQERTLGTSHPDLGMTLAHLAIAQRGMSQLVQARSTADRAVTILRGANPPRPADLAMAVNVLGNILGRQGKFEQARSLLLESLSLYEETKGREHPYVAAALTQLAMLESKVGNYDGALSLLMRALAINERSYGEDNPEIAGNLYEIGLAERALGNGKSSRKRFERALEIQNAAVDQNHPFVASTLIELAEARRQDGDLSGARALLQRALQIQERSLGRDHPAVAQTLTILGYLEGQSNKFSSAESFFSRAVQIRETALGPGHKDVARSLFDLARAKHAQGHLVASRPLYERARQILQAQSAENAGLDDEAMSKIWKSDLKGLQDYAHMLAALTRDTKQPAEQQSAVSDAFVVAQEARGWLVQAAVAQSIAQRQGVSEKTLGVAMRFEELRRKRLELWTRLNEVYGVPERDRSAGELDKLKQDLSQLQYSLDQAGAELRTQAPRYAELAQPRPLDISAVLPMLRPDEALISFYTLGDRVQMWLLRSGKPVAYRETLVPRAKLVSLVEKVRSSIVPQQRTNSESPVSVAYDVEAAADLYQILFNSLEQHLANVSQLFLAPDEVLFPLPFAALLTDRRSKQFSRFAQIFQQGRVPSLNDLVDYAGLPWFVKSYTSTVLPSISALKMLRQNAATIETPKESFIGFGDPLLQGSGHERGGKMVPARGMRVAGDTLRRLDNLPGTRDELLAVARLLGVDPETNVFINRRATEPEVRRLNSTGRLGSTKVLSFATHGLLAGELQGVTQPALVLTPPDIPTEENDGLLSMDDIFDLKLHSTEWVILSACNTAGADGSGESLSGLSRAFFFAGAKALLVSQWSVDDEATRSLMEQIFQRYSDVESIPPAKALREGMLALFEIAVRHPEKRYFAHPHAWASFMLVGDGGGSPYQLSGS